MIPTPTVDWLALSPTLALLGASGVALLGSVLVPSWLRRAFTAFVVLFSGFSQASAIAMKGVTVPASRRTGRSAVEVS